MYQKVLLLVPLFIDIPTCENYMKINLVIMNLEYLFAKETLMGGAHADSKLSSTLTKYRLIWLGSEGFVSHARFSICNKSLLICIL